MKRSWIVVLALGLVATAAGATAIDEPPAVFRVYSQEDSVLVGDTTRAYVVYINEKQRRNMTPNVRWSSVDTSATTLSNLDGWSTRIRVKRAGTHRVAAVLTDGNRKFHDTLVVRAYAPAPPKVTSFEVSPTGAVTLEVGQSMAYSVTRALAGTVELTASERAARPFAWSLSNTNATVVGQGTTGTVTATARGFTVLTVTLDGVQVQRAVAVADPVPPPDTTPAPPDTTKPPTPPDTTTPPDTVTPPPVGTPVALRFERDTIAVGERTRIYVEGTHTSRHWALFDYGTPTNLDLFRAHFGTTPVASIPADSVQAFWFRTPDAVALFAPPDSTHWVELDRLERPQVQGLRPGSIPVTVVVRRSGQPDTVLTRTLHVR